jgi:hypothetical protein
MQTMFKQVTPQRWLVLVGSACAGELVPKEDGFYDFWLDENRQGYLPAWFLRAVADKLDEINTPWRDEIAKALSQGVDTGESSEVN